MNTSVELQPTNHYAVSKEKMVQGLSEVVTRLITSDGYEERTDLNIPISRDRVADNYDVDLTKLHDESVRALCHYASVAAGEATGTGIRYDHEKMIDVQPANGPKYTVKGIFELLQRRT